jgi:internalin A
VVWEGSSGASPLPPIPIVGRNQLTALPETLGQLTALLGLNAAQNQFARLPEWLRQVSSLTSLFLHDNPALGLPPEVLDPSWEDTSEHGQAVAPSGIVAYYFNSRVAKPLNEAKLILVGFGGVGKTSLVHRLTTNTFNPHEQKTDGIAITPWKIQIGQDEVRLNIWDFGGQEIMHATHQFFFTKRSVYVLVLKAREGAQEADIEYWLQLIESFGGESPVIVVINRIKEYAFDLNRRGLQEKFHSIRDFVLTDCEDGRGVSDLLASLRRETDHLEHLRDPFPASWFVVKDKLATLQGNYIDFEEYRNLCEEHGISDDKSQETLVGFLHDLGLVINFRDDSRLADTHVLSPHWVTNGIYKILNCEAFAQRKGELHFSELKQVLDDREYPKKMHQFLLDLMGKFELCYEFYDDNGNYLIPELLGKDEPDLSKYVVGDPLRFEYHYNILPEGLLPRLVVRSRSLNKGLPRWRTGAVLEFEENRAIVKADIQGRKVAIAVYGKGAGRRRLLSVIRSDFEALHASITRLQVQQRVPIPSHPNVWVDYQTLLVLESEGETEHKEVAGGKVIRYSIQELLKGVEEPASRSTMPRDRQGLSAKPITVVYSYSHIDAELRDQLETHLALLKRTGVISTWHDRKITGGEEWKGKIDDRFKQADLILLLVSADFVSSDYCWDIEMKMALERHEKGEAKVVPIIIRECQWHKAPFAKLEPLPKDGNAVKESPSRDRAWKTIADGIEEASLEIRRRK